MIRIHLIIKFQILFWLIWFFTSIPTHTQWFQQESGTESQLNSVFFLDSLNGWIVGDDSTILRTTNAGEEWISLQSGFNNDFYDLCFTSDSVGFIVGGEGIDLYRTGIILYTSNAGQTWTQQCDSISRDLYAISFANEQVGYISGGGPIYPGAGIILKTKNAGVSWDTVYFTNSPYGDNLYDIDFVNLNVGWAVGGIQVGIGSHIAIKTTDGGETWVTQNPPISCQAFICCDFISEKEGWIGAYRWDYTNDVMLFTEDGGSSWSNQLLPDSIFYLSSIFFIDESTGWTTGGYYDRIYKTTDKGNTWARQLHPLTGMESFRSIFFVNKNLGWIVCADGVILKTTNGGVSFVEEEEINETPTKYYLSNNFPNPFNPSTKIRFSIPHISKVVIKIFNVLGDEIETLVNEEKPVGTYEVEFNTASHSRESGNLTSGIYFYQLKAGSFVETKKMVLLR